MKAAGMLIMTLISGFVNELECQDFVTPETKFPYAAAVNDGHRLSFHGLF